MPILLRILTVLCYLLPFTFFVVGCENGCTLKTVYNKADAALLDTPVHHEADTLAEDTLSVAAASPVPVTTDSAAIQTDHSSFNPLWGSVVFRSVFPTNRSLSGIGVLLYFKNKAGSIFIGIALGLALFTLFIPAWLKRYHLLLLSLQLLGICLFIADSLICAAGLLWGVWVLVALLVLQLLLTGKILLQARKTSLTHKDQ